MKLFSRPNLVMLLLYLIMGCLAYVVLFPQQVEVLSSLMSVDQIHERKSALQPPAEPRPQVIQVYFINGEQARIEIPGPVCTRVCLEDQERTRARFSDLCVKAGYQAYPGPCCDTVCTGYVKWPPAS